jgi:Sortase domain
MGLLVLVALAALASAGLVTGRVTVGNAGLLSQRPQSPAPGATSPAPVATPSSDGGLAAAARAIVAPAAAPVQLLVPAIGVRATVEAVGLDKQGRMATPSRADNVAWYRPGTAPGDAGNAVIAGHLDWTSGPAVFWRLGSLRRGDQITVARADGSQAAFVVDGTSTMSFDAPTDSLFTRAGPPSLTLITCAGAWDRQRATYLQRLVVHAALAPRVVTAEKPGS